MITIRINKTEKYTRNIGSGDQAKMVDEERDKTIYEQAIDDEKFDLQAVIAVVNGLQKPPTK